jgi:hypothetical protein
MGLGEIILAILAIILMFLADPSSEWDDPCCNDDSSGWL